MHLQKFPTAVENLIDDSDISIFPNPSTDKITIQSKQVPITSFELFSVASQTTVKSELFSANKLNIDIDLSPFSSGVYFLKINKHSNFKIIKTE